MIHRFAPASTLCAIIFSSAQTTFATELSVSSADNTENIENITVTASRTATELAAAGSSISIITGEEIRRRGAVTLAELLRDTPGMSVNQAGPRGTVAQVRMRGGEANHLLVLIDGVEANDLSQGNEFNFAHLLTQGIERVEIVRGPQSALWGSDALAGVINIITLPRAAEGASSISVESGSFGTTSAAAQVSGGASGNRWSVGANHIEADGTNISRIGNEDDGYRNTTLRGSGRFKVSDNAAVVAMARYTDSRNEFDGTDFVTTGLPVDTDDVSASAQGYVKLGVELQLTSTVRQSLAVHYVDTESVTRTGAATDDVTQGERATVVSQTDIEFGQQTLSLVAEHERDAFSQRGAITAFGNPNKDLDTDRTSVAAEMRHDSALVNVSASFRHERNSEFDDANTWRLTGLVRATDRLGVFAAAGKSIKNPTFSERFGFFDTFVGNPDLTPETSHSWEVGLRYLVRDTLNVSLSYFDAELTNEINGFVFDSATGGFTADNSIGQSERRGAELEASWQPNAMLSLIASYSWIDATEPAAGIQIEEARRPGNTAALRANFSANRLNVNVGATHSGHQIDTWFPPFPMASQRVTLDAFTLVDAAISYAITPNVTVRARVENALDETYEEIYGYRSPGLGAFAGIEVSW